MKRREESFERRCDAARLRARGPRLRTPSRAGSWLHGFVNGRTGTAAADPDTSAVRSGYIEAVLAGHRSFTARRRAGLSESVTACCAELSQLVLEFRRLDVPDAAQPGTPEAIRAGLRRRERKAAALRDMIRLQTLLFQNVRRYNCETEDAAQRVARGLAGYCKGVLFRKPLRPEMIPAPKADRCDPERDFPELTPVLQSIRELLNAESKEAERHAEPSAV